MDHNTQRVHVTEAMLEIATTIDRTDVVKGLHDKFLSLGECTICTLSEV